MKVTAILLAVLLAFSLCACAPRRTAQNPDTRGDSADTAGPGTQTDTTQQEADNTADNADGAGTADAGNSGYAGQTGPDGPTAGSGGSGFDDDTNEKRFYYAGRLYEITEETVDPQDVGAELFSITDIVDGDPGAQGEGLGLDLDTRIYKFKDENEYDTLAVRIGKMYRKATVREDTLLPSAGTDGGMENGTGTDSGSGQAGTAGRNAKGVGTRFGMR